MVLKFGEEILKILKHGGYVKGAKKKMCSINFKLSFGSVLLQFACWVDVTVDYVLSCEFYFVEENM